MVGTGVFLVTFPLFMGQVSEVIRGNEALLIDNEENRHVGIFLQEADKVSLNVFVRGGGDSPKNTIYLGIRNPDKALVSLEGADAEGGVSVPESQTINFEATKKGAYTIFLVNKDKVHKSISLAWVIDTSKSVSVINLNPEIVSFLRAIGGSAIGFGTAYGSSKYKDEKLEEQKVGGGI